MNTILIAVTVLFFVTQSAALKKIKIISLRQNLLSTAISSGMIAAALAVWAVAVRPAFSAETLLYGAIFGAVFVVTLAAYYFAMQSGPLSYTSFFFSASMLIPSVAGLLFWKEPFRWNVGIGIVLFLAAFYFITVLGGSKGGKVSRRWLVLCALTWACNGSLSILPRPEKRPLQVEDLLPEPPKEILPCLLILDGHINENQLQRAGYDLDWLDKKIKRLHYRSVQEIFVAGLDSEGSFFAQPKASRNK